MPIPTQHRGEDRQKFLLRCNSDGVMLSEFPDNNQRAAVCHSQWRASVKKEEEPMLKAVIYKIKSVLADINCVGAERAAQDIWFELTDVQKESLQVFEHVPDVQHSRYTIQRCYVGKSFYDILNLDITNGEVVRWILPGNFQNDKPVTTLKAAEALSVSDPLGEDRCVVQLGKASKVWMNFDGVQPAGTRGASEEFPGVLKVIKSGVLAFGDQLPYRHDYVLDGVNRISITLSGSTSDAGVHAAKSEPAPPAWVCRIVSVDTKNAFPALAMKSVAVADPEYIVGGIVYPAEQVDAQGDLMSVEEIWKMLKHFMLEGREFSVEHAGQRVDLPIIECFQAEVDTVKGGKPLTAGSFWLSVSVEDYPELFKAIQKGAITGWSLEGRGQAEKVGDN